MTWIRNEKVSRDKPHNVAPSQTKGRRYTKKKESEAKGQQKAISVERPVLTLLHTLLSDSPATKTRSPATQLLVNLCTPHVMTTTKRQAFAQS